MYEDIKKAADEAQLLYWADRLRAIVKHESVAQSSTKKVTPAMRTGMFLMLEVLKELNERTGEEPSAQFAEVAYKYKVKRARDVVPPPVEKFISDYEAEHPELGKTIKKFTKSGYIQ